MENINRKAVGSVNQEMVPKAMLDMALDQFPYCANKSPKCRKPLKSRSKITVKWRHAMKKTCTLVFAMILTVVFAFTAPVSTGSAQGSTVLPELISFSHGIGSVYQTGRESGAGYVTYNYQCGTEQVESVVQEYIRELRKSGIYIAQSEKTVYDSAANDTNRGVALREKNNGRAKFTMNDPAHGWMFENVSVYIGFSTGGDYNTQYIMISYAEGAYEIADTGARMRTDRRFSPADYYFYRNQLKTDVQRTAYDYILSKVEAMESYISLEGLPGRMNDDDFFLAWYSVLIDNPQIFTTDDNWISRRTYFSDGTVRGFTVNYYQDKSSLPAMQRTYEQAIAEALEVIDPYMTDYQKELALHDWICDHVRYDYDIGVKSTCSYSGLVDGLAVCEGYSELFTELLHRAGIDAATVYGFIPAERPSDNNSHAWNIVCIDGDWYYVDVTWDDNRGDYNYFNLTTAQMAADHVNGIGTFPLCSSRDASYRK